MDIHRLDRLATAVRSADALESEIEAILERLLPEDVRDRSSLNKMSDAAQHAIRSMKLALLMAVGEAYVTVHHPIPGPCGTTAE